MHINGIEVTIMYTEPRIVNIIDWQNRSRDADTCVKWLLLDKFPLAGNDVLFVGGGKGCYSSFFRDHEVMAPLNITNIDLHIDEILAARNPSITSIQADFTDYDGFGLGQFDEIEAVFSLPVYAVHCAQVELFILKSMLCLRPGGKLRVSGPNSFRSNCNIRQNPKFGRNFPAFSRIWSKYEEMINYVMSCGMASEHYLVGCGCNSHHRLETRLDVITKSDRNTDFLNRRFKDRIDYIIDRSLVPSYEVEFKDKFGNLVTLSYGGESR